MVPGTAEPPWRGVDCQKVLLARHPSEYRSLFSRRLDVGHRHHCSGCERPGALRDRPVQEIDDADGRGAHRDGEGEEGDRAEPGGRCAEDRPMLRCPRRETDAENEHPGLHHLPLRGLPPVELQAFQPSCNTVTRSHDARTHGHSTREPADHQDRRSRHRRQLDEWPTEVVTPNPAMTVGRRGGVIDDASVARQRPSNVVRTALDTGMTRRLCAQTILLARLTVRLRPAGHVERRADRSRRGALVSRRALRRERGWIRYRGEPPGGRRSAWSSRGHRGRGRGAGSQSNRL